MKKNIEMFVNRKIKTLDIYENIVVFSDELYVDDQLVKRKEGLSLKEYVDEIELFDTIAKLNENEYFVIPKVILDKIRSISKYEVKSNINPYTALSNYPNRFIVLKKDKENFLRTINGDYIPTAIFLSLTNENYNIYELKKYFESQPSRFHILSISDDLITLDWIPSNIEYDRFILNSGNMKIIEKITWILQFKK